MEHRLRPRGPPHPAPGSARGRRSRPSARPGHGPDGGLRRHYGVDSGIDVDPADFVGDLASTAPGPSLCSALLLAGFAHVQHGKWARQPGSSGRRSRSRRRAETWTCCPTWAAALYLGDDAVALDAYGRFVAHARDAGAPVTVLYGLARRAPAEIAVGEWSTAAAGSAEARDLARATGQDPLESLPLAWLTLLAALRGDHGEFQRNLAELERPTRARDVGPTSLISRDVILWAKGVATADPAAALHHLELITHPMVRNLSALDRIESATRSGREDLVAGWADELTSIAARTRMPWAAAAASHARALLTTGSESSGLFERALAAHADSPRRPDQARTHLALGEHLRRLRRRIDAREHLKAALETFEDIGATRWAERARQELRASGETARRRDAGVTVDLTAQERHVAALVRQGLNNRDVAAQLFVSPRTVDFHLRNVFAKLGISSRAELVALELD